MVKRYYVGDEGLEEDAEGVWLAYSDYLAVRDALREALDGWYVAEETSMVTTHPNAPSRIAALRAQFLDDK